MTLRGRSGGGFVAALCRLLHAVLSGGLFVLISSVCRRAFAEETGALCSAGGGTTRPHAFNTYFIPYFQPPESPFV